MTLFETGSNVLTTKSGADDSKRNALSGSGVLPGRPVHANLTAPALIQASIQRNEGTLSADGALLVQTGHHTGRSAQDKFVVDEPSTSAEIWWGNVNKKLAPEKFAGLRGRV